MGTKTLEHKTLLDYKYNIRLYKYNYRYDYEKSKMHRHETFRITVNSRIVLKTPDINKALKKFKKLVKDRQDALEKERVVYVAKKKKLRVRNKRLKELIDYRLDNIHERTIESYNIVQDIITLAELYELDLEYIIEIKDRFKEFKL